MNTKTIKLLAAATILLVTGLQFVHAADHSEPYRPYAPDGVPFTVATTAWHVDRQGNHRAVIKVTKTKGDAARVVLKWRRPDLKPEGKLVRIVDAATHDTLDNVKINAISGEQGDITFQPKTVPGVYDVYYLPYRYRPTCDDARYGNPWNDYLSPEYHADPSWLARLPKDKGKIPQAQVLRYEARTAFDFFTSMGTTATADETRRLLGRHKESPIVVQEDRVYAIRLTDRLPYRWVKTGLKADFRGEACRNEYYVWQVGVIAHRDKVDNVRLSFSDFVHQKSGAVIAKDSFTCFNLGGRGWDGQPVSFRVDVPKGKTQALWCGVQIPANATEGDYVGQVTLTADGMEPRVLPVTIHVDGRTLADKGDGDLWRLSRLRWLNSTIGIDDHPVKPFLGMSVSGRQIEATDKKLTLAANGLPASIEINGRQILAKPLSFVIETPDGDITLQARDLSIKQEADGLVTWTASSVQQGMTFTLQARMEYDGYVNLRLHVKSPKPTTVKDIRLTADYTPYASRYYMGTGFDGGRRPEQLRWDWTGPYDSYWIGNALAGLHVEYRGSTYNGPLLNDYKPQAPAVWANEGKGFISVNGARDQETRVLTATGATIIGTEGKTFELALLITPARPVDISHQFSQRYYHSTAEGFDKAAEDGANIINIHHSQPLNPFINYPFIERDSLKLFINHEHQAGRKVKLYYTIRELSNYCAEIYALKSLNHEVFTAGPGLGLPWLCEHLIDDYKPAWYTPLSGGRQDISLMTTGFSRWINYWLEGYRWMLENYQLDGIYMDDVAFDRDVMKRLRKIMERSRPGSLIDLHSNTGYSRGPANQYTGFFPYVDRLWFGESFQYDKLTPDGWFVTFSGIPFGVMSEMLQDGGNQWLGTVYGASTRHSTYKAHPAPVWRVWRDFDIEHSQMEGYWLDDCPISTDQPLVKATAFVKTGRTLVAIGNFDNQDHNTQLTIDWKALGLDAGKVVITAPRMDGYQPARTFRVGETIPVKAKQGWLLLIEEK